jgi:hypothetical protein
MTVLHTYIDNSEDKTAALHNTYVHMTKTVMYIKQVSSHAFIFRQIPLHAHLQCFCYFCFCTMPLPTLLYMHDITFYFRLPTYVHTGTYILHCR